MQQSPMISVLHVRNSFIKQRLYGLHSCSLVGLNTSVIDWKKTGEQKVANFRQKF